MVRRFRLLLLVLVVSSAFLVAAPVSAGDPACTITGTEADDVLSGTAGPDVICGLGGDDVIDAGAGDDVVFGGIGDDVIYGGDGDDELHGNEDNDEVYGDAGDDWLGGGKGDDVIYGGDGADRVEGKRGADTIYGGPGDDSLAGNEDQDRVYGEAGDDWLGGGKGADELYGGIGNDALEGKRGDDNLTGGPGVDSADGGFNDDTCAAEVVTSCEIELPDEAGDVTAPEVQVLSPADGSAVGATATVEVQATDDEGVAQVELLIDGIVAGSSASPDGDGIFRFELAFETSGTYQVSSRATDAAGNVGDSDVVSVTMPAEALPSTYLVFSDAQTMVDVFAVLESEGLHPVEFEHVVIQADGEATGGGFYAPDLPTADQEAYYRALQHDRYGVDPDIISVRIGGSHTASALGELSDQVGEIEQVPALSGIGEAGEGQQTQASFASAASARSAEAEVPREDWWPDAGRVDAFESSFPFVLPPPCIRACPPVPFLVQPTRNIVHEFEWHDQEATDLWGGGFAYEHDFKLINESLNPNTWRPFCGFASDDFWASRIMIHWDSTIPARARPYLDTGVFDECTRSDFTIGILRPVAVDAGFYTTEITTLPGDLDESPYQLEAQRMGKTLGVLCPFKWCVNAPGSAQAIVQPLVPLRREDGSERTVPVECTDWSVLDLVQPADPVVDEEGCGS